MTPKLIAPLAALLSAKAGAAVDFVSNVQPILEQHCLRCHSSRSAAVEMGATEYVMDTFQTASADPRRFIVPGYAENSRFYRLSTGTHHMQSLGAFNGAKHEVESRPLTGQETETIRRWINEGAKWPETARLVPRKLNGLQDFSPSISEELRRRISAYSREKTEAEMKAYASNIIGSRVMFEMVPIPGGTFKMGSPDNEAGRKGDEGPQREVTVEPFWMGKTEVTWDEFQVFMFPSEDRITRKTIVLTPAQADITKISDQVAHPTAPYVEMSFGMGTEGFPAISMTQHAANKYCQWLSARTGHFYRLPTEAEWEYAARAGTTTAYHWGDDASKVGEYAWWGKNADFKYQKVGTKKPNPWGLYDMLGNVAEWTLDQYDAEYYRKRPSFNPWNVATKPYPHAVRGGSWDDEDPAKLRVAARIASTPDWKRQDPDLPKSRWYHTDAQTVGFRIVRPLKVPSADAMHRSWNSGVEKDEMR